MAPSANKTKDAAPKGKANKKAPAPETPTTPPAAEEAKVDTTLEDIGPVLITYTGTGKPDKVAYDAEQETIKKEIEKYQTQVVRTAGCCSFLPLSDTMAGYRMRSRTRLDRVPKAGLVPSEGLN